MIAARGSSMSTQVQTRMRRTDADPGALSDQLYMSPSDYLLDKFQGDAMLQHYQRVDELLEHWNAVSVSRLQVVKSTQTQNQIYFACETVFVTCGGRISVRFGRSVAWLR
jgi:hypothetical protein